VSYQKLPSAPWGTLLGQTLISPVMFADARTGGHRRRCDVAFRPAPSIDASRATIHRPSVDWGRSLQPSSVGARLGKNHLQDGTEARKSSGRDPPRHLPLRPGSRRPCWLSFVRGGSAFATDGSVRSICPRVLGRLQFWVSTRRTIESSMSSQGRHFVQSARCWRRDLHNGGNIGEPQVVPPIAGTIFRRTMTQPGVFWLLDTPFADIIGLYSNVAENPGFISGKISGKHQKAWLIEALKRVAKLRQKGPRKALLLAAHHPPFSSAGHSGSKEMLADIDDACARGGLMPDVFLAAHAHSYQRYTRRVAFPGKQMEIPFVVVGTGGINDQNLGDRRLICASSPDC
jgi:hypothetical protein